MNNASDFDAFRASIVPHTLQLNTRAAFAID
jgi:hypothetical protein